LLYRGSTKRAFVPALIAQFCQQFVWTFGSRCGPGSSLCCPT